MNFTNKDMICMMIVADLSENDVVVIILDLVLLVEEVLLGILLSHTLVGDLHLFHFNCQLLFFFFLRS